ncbi:MAG: hypothetical protein PVF91_12120 [Chromatiales bacterium]|jgi:chromosome segregation ATPase
MGTYDPQRCEELGQSIDEAEQAWSDALQEAFSAKAELIAEVEAWAQDEDALSLDDIEDLREEIAGLTDQLEELSARADELQAEYDTLRNYQEEAVEEYLRVELALRAYEEAEVVGARVQALEDEIDEKTRELEQLQEDDPDSTGDEQARVNLSVEILALQQELQNLEQILTDIFEEIAEFDDLEEQKLLLADEIDALTARLLEINTELTETVAARERTQSQIDLREAQIEAGQRRIDELEAALELEMEDDPENAGPVVEALAWLQELREEYNDHCR